MAISSSPTLTASDARARIDVNAKVEAFVSWLLAGTQVPAACPNAHLTVEIVGGSIVRVRINELFDHHRQSKTGKAAQSAPNDSTA